MGSRLSPLTKVTNKHLLPVYNNPIIFKVIRTLTYSGINEITFVLGGESVGDIVRLLGDGSDFNARFNYVYQQQAGGIAEALYLTKDIIKDQKIAVILGDNFFEDIFTTEIDEFQNTSDYECCLFLKQVDNPERFGVAELNNNGSIKMVQEKPTYPKSNYVVTGFYLYDENIFKVIEQVINDIGYSNRGELEITDVNNWYVERGYMTYSLIEGFWSDAGTVDSLYTASTFAKLQSR